ncbi:MAG: lipoprotein NlpI [Mucilaginibacter sp.]|nr:lipoprotein NlpI [Mucilaginibacter sp.]
MKTIKILATILIFVCNTAFAQNNEDAKALVREGVQLNDQGKYAEAIEKYNQALKMDPGNIYADFELAYTLFISGKGTDGIPYLKKVIAANTSLTAGAYDLLGTIYDKDNQKDKAIEAYNAGIKANPGYQRLYYNLGIVYSRYKQYAEAEKCAIEAIKLDPKHASSQRMYALVNFHQNKRVPALLGFCSFILLEPNTVRSTEAYNNIQHILQGGVLKNSNGGTTITLSPKDNTETTSQNLGISMSVISGQQKKLTGVDLLEYELKSIFTITGELSQKKTDKGFFDKFYADYFYKLAQSNNMPAFTRSINAGTPDNAAWIADHPQYMNDLYMWIRATERSVN